MRGNAGRRAADRSSFGTSPESEAGREAASRRAETPPRLGALGKGAISFGLYLALFAAFAWPWLRSLTDSLPRSFGTPFVFADDARFIVLVIAWAARTIASQPLALFDLPIQHPAPRQLTGSEHFLTSQLVAAPVFWASGNALLAANLAAFASYPLAALAAQLFLRELGAAAVPAWIGGLLFALGPLRVPASVQILQYLNLFLPLLAWALTRLRKDPSRARAGAVLAVAVLGGLSSYHMAAMLAVVGTVWTAVELARPLPERGRFVARALEAAALAAAVLVVVSLPYFLRPEARDVDLLGTIGIRGASPVRDTVRWFTILAPTFFGAAPLVVAGWGLVALALPPVGGSRRLAGAGLLFVVVGGLLMLPPEPVRALIDESPLRFLRAPWRFVVIAGLGTALLSTAGLEWLRGRVPRALASAVMVAVVAAVLFHGRRLVENGLDPVPALAFDRAVYEEVARSAAAHGSGPLLELPVTDALGQGGRSDVPRALIDPDAMVGATLHGQPLVTGKTGYPPPHRRMIDEMIQRLPSAAALQEIVDATHLRWLLLRPEGYWADIRVRRRLLELPGVETAFERDDWVLARVDLKPGRLEWYAGISAPAPRERSPLGAPLAPLGARGAAGAVEVVAGLLPRVPARYLLPIATRVENVGTEVWPVTAYVGTRYGVFLGARWTPVEGSTGEPAVQALSLPRDLSPGESLEQQQTLKTPPVAGTYDFEMRVKQWGGTPFGGATDRPYRLRVEVVGPPS